MSAPFTLSAARARALWIEAQALGVPRSTPSPEGTVARAGFVRTLGGVDGYLAIFARVREIGTAAVDADLGAGKVAVLPAARGCMYLVARTHAPLALHVAHQLTRPRIMRDEVRSGIRPGELADVGAAVLEALGDGAMTVDALKKALPAGTVRSLGDQGKWVGVTSTLPPALRVLELDGALERIPLSGRLDTERYLWRRPARGPDRAWTAPESWIEAITRLADVFFHWAGAARLSDFTEWAGVGKKEAAEAIRAGALEPVAVDGWDEPAWIHERWLDAPWALLEARAQTALALLPFEDNLITLHGGARDLVVPAHHGLEVPRWGSGTESTLGESRHMTARTVLAEGRVVGLWEHDPGTGRIVVETFESVTIATRNRLDALAAEVSGFLAPLGHARSFSLDTDEAMTERSAFVRGLRGKRGAADAKGAKPQRA